jgi:hypothetical protein
VATFGGSGKSNYLLEPTGYDIAIASPGCSDPGLGGAHPMTYLIGDRLGRSSEQITRPRGRARRRYVAALSPAG